MEGKKLQEVTRIPRSQGILGQEVFILRTENISGLFGVPIQNYGAGCLRI